MAVTLDDATKASIFEILSGFWAGATATISNGFGVTMSISDLDLLTANINARLAALDDTAKTKLIALVAEWDSISNVDFAFEGDIGSVKGVKYSTDIHRARIQKQVHVYVPVLNMYEAVKVRNGQTNQASSGSGNTFGIGR
jgi:hypothetical protein